MLKLRWKVDQYHKCTLLIIEIHSNLTIVKGTRCKRHAIIFSVVCCAKAFCTKDRDPGKELVLGHGELLIKGGEP